MDRPEAHDPDAGAVICVDFGSTFTKASLVDLADGRIVAAAEHRTTIDTDVLDGYDACLAGLAEILAHHPIVVAPNIVPRIGALAPEGARTAIRELFLSHVIGGKHLSSRDDFLAMVQGATPDVVLTGVELLADVAGDTVVVDVGGATTDVHSVVELDPALRDGSSLAS